MTEDNLLIFHRSLGPPTIASAKPSHISSSIKPALKLLVRRNRLEIRLQQFIVAFFTCSGQLSHVKVRLDYDVPYDWVVKYAEYRVFKLAP